MKFKAWLTDKIEGAILGNIAKGLAAGKYGPRLQKLYGFGKGYLSWTSAALAIAFQAASYFDNTGVAASLSNVSMVAFGLGLARKGAHLEPPKLPQEMRDAMEGGLSIVAWILMAAQGVVWACSQAGASWACGINAGAQDVVMVGTAVSAFLATYVSDPPEATTTTQKEHPNG